MKISRFILVLSLFPPAVRAQAPGQDTIRKERLKADLFFHTGLHPDYHTEYDRPEKIEYDKLERIARLVHQTSWELAGADSRPNFDRPERAAAAP